MNFEITPFYRSAIDACRKVRVLLSGELSATLFDKNGFIGAGGDLSSGMDLAVERLLIDALSPFGSIDSEESGRIGEGESTIVLDPLDGSSNALSRFPYYGISIARIGADGVLKEALVCNLANGDLFLIDEAGNPLKGSLDHDRFKPPVAPPNPEIGLFEKAYAHPRIVAALDQRGLKFRNPGAVALSLAYARYVNYMLFVGPFRIYDFAAGLALCKGLEVIVEEDFVIVARDPKVAEDLRALVEEERDGGSHS